MTRHPTDSPPVLYSHVHCLELAAVQAKQLLPRFNLDFLLQVTPKCLQQGLNRFEIIYRVERKGIVDYTGTGQRM